MPERIQLKRAKGWRMPPNTVKVDRSTRYGNPFRIGPEFNTHTVRSAEEAVRRYRKWISDPFLQEHYRAALRGKNLACWCKPGDPCHADVLLEIANS